MAYTLMRSFSHKPSFPLQAVKLTAYTHVHTSIQTLTNMRGTVCVVGTRLALMMWVRDFILHTPPPSSTFHTPSPPLSFPSTPLPLHSPLLPHPSPSSLLPIVQQAQGWHWPTDRHNDIHTRGVRGQQSTGAVWGQDSSRAEHSAGVAL